MVGQRCQPQGSGFALRQPLQEGHFTIVGRELVVADALGLNHHDAQASLSRLGSFVRSLLMLGSRACGRIRAASALVVLVIGKQPGIVSNRRIRG